MIKVYVSSSCGSCRKAMEWLRKHRIEFEAVNLSKTSVLREDLIKILRVSENGLSDIISTRSHSYRTLKSKLEDLPLNKALDLIEKDNSLLKRPILFDERHFQVGFNSEEIRQFIPAQVRKMEMKMEKI